MKNTNNKVAFITGASSGIGKACAALMAQNGYTVYGTSRRADYKKIEAGGAAYTMIPMTLEDEQTVVDAVQYIIDAEGCIDVVVNAAGSGIAGAIEETSPGEAKTQFDVCFFGVVSVLNHVLPHMRAAKNGMIINIGSMASCFPIAFQGMYSAVKSALFMMTATMRMELKPFGIKACVIEPGDTKTGFTDKRVFTKKSKESAYKKPLERALYEMIRSELASDGPEKCARLVLRTAGKKSPPARLSVGFDNKVLYALARLTSWRFKERILTQIYLRKDPPKDAVWAFDKQFKNK